ncbi:protein kinase [Sphaerimonospora cavernae]|uniref:Protein kinase n=1 Tax=Sphaerimonospora cavernae TaxID=1740611 RepID=A0ABV6U2B7_9ACTN
MNQDDRLGPYRLLRRLGEGGMGVVHLALDPRGREVAVKVLRSEVTGDDVARRRLSREVETMRRVRSPHVAEVLDADVTGLRPYIVTRYVPGRPLDEIVKQDGPLALDALLKVAGGVAEALAAVHAAGVVHRDLKPGNVLMLDGRPVLIDFGISQGADATRLTQTGMFIGTPGYLAPEIIEGHEAGPEVDVHAWAGTLLFAATGQPPFGKGTLEMIFYNITSGRSNVAAAPEPLQPMLRAAFQRDPARRPSAVELADWVARLTRPTADRPRVPDEITTVPNVDDTGGRPTPGPGTSGGGTSGGGTAGPGQGEFVSLLADPPSLDGTSALRSSPAPPVPGGAMAPGAWGQGNGPEIMDTPVFRGNAGRGGDPAPPHGPIQPIQPGQPGQPVRPGAAPPAAQGGDPFPTVRVTGEDLRRAGIGPGGPVHAQPAGSPEGDIPTRRVTSEELRQVVPQSFLDQPPKGVDQTPEIFKKGAEIFEQTPLIPQSQQAPFVPTLHMPPPSASPGMSGPPMQSPYQQHYQQHNQQHQGPYQQPLPGGVVPRHSKAYGVAAALLFVLMMGAAVIAPLLVWVLMLPVAVLLRAADMAHSRLDTRRLAGASPADLIRVFSRPDAIMRSVGATIALVPYGLVLGLPVTVLLTLLVPSASVLAALSWGLAVALWTVCAGPGVEGPRRQLRRTLASVIPGDGAAPGVAWGIAAATAVVALVALASLVDKQTAGHFWGPVDVLSVVERLRELRIHMGNQ